MANGFGPLREGYPSKKTVRGSCVRIGTVISTTLFSTALVVRFMLLDEDGEPQPTEVDCRAVFTPQTEYWKRQYTLDSTYTSRFAANAYCVDDQVITVEWMGEYLVVGQYINSPGYEDEKLPYLWPVFENGIVTGFYNSSNQDGTDFPFFTDENGANVQPIAPYTDFNGQTRAAGSSTVVSPWGVLTPQGDGYVFHRQYEFSKGDSRIVLEPYDEAKVFRGGGIEVGVNELGTKLLLNGIPFAEVLDPLASIQMLNVLSFSPLIVGTLEGYDGASSGNYTVGRATLYMLDDICYRNLVQGLDELPSWPPAGSWTAYLYYYGNYNTNLGDDRIAAECPAFPEHAKRFAIFPGGYVMEVFEKHKVGAEYKWELAKVWYTYNVETDTFDMSTTYISPKLAFARSIPD